MRHPAGWAVAQSMASQNWSRWAAAARTHRAHRVAELRRNDDVEQISVVARSMARASRVEKPRLRHSTLKHSPRLCRVCTQSRTHRASSNSRRPSRGDASPRCSRIDQDVAVERNSHRACCGIAVVQLVAGPIRRSPAFEADLEPARIASRRRARSRVSSVSPGMSTAGTSLATGTPWRVIVTSSPLAAAPAAWRTAGSPRAPKRCACDPPCSDVTTYLRRTPPGST